MMRCTKLMAVAAVGALSVVSAARAGAQIVAGHVDNFEDGTTQNWAINLLGMAPPPPAAFPRNIATGGPAGVNDNFLLLTAVGGVDVPGNRLTAFNNSPAWTGNYLSAGITGIRMDAINLGTTALFLRLLFEDPIAGPPVDQAVSAVPWILPVNSGWRSFFFPISGPGDLVTLSGNRTTLLSNTTTIRIFSNAAADFPGPPIVASLGVDNITAVGATAVPEPSTVVLLGTGMLGVFALQRRRRRISR